MASVLSFTRFDPFREHDHAPLIHRSLSASAHRLPDFSRQYWRQRQLSSSSINSAVSRLPPPVRRPVQLLPSRPHSTTTNTRDHSPAHHSVYSNPSATLSFAYSTFSDSAAGALQHRDSFGSDALIPPPSGTSDDGDDVGMSDSSDDDKDGMTAGEVWHESPETPETAGSPEHLDFVDTLDEQRDHFPTFRRWVSTLRRRNGNTLTPVNSPGLLKDIQWKERNQEQGTHTAQDHQTHRHSGSHASSLAFVTGIRSASMTMTSSSLPSINASGSVRSPHSTMALLSNPNSNVDLRRSMDSDSQPMTPITDEAALRRAQKRARKVQELVRTEEGYVVDLKALHHAFFTLLIPHQSANRSATQACMSEMLQLHEQILAELRSLLTQLVPCGTPSKRPQRPRGRPRVYTTAGRFDALSPDRAHENRRWKRTSLDLPRSSLSDGMEHLCSPQLAADIARVFMDHAGQLAIYEEYGARCESMHREIDGHLSSSPTLDHDRALETLQASICPTQGKTQRLKKALGFKDLLIKRIPRYELLFKDLCTLTPFGDNVVANATVHDALAVITQTCHDLNKASGNAERLRAFDGRRLLQERLLFEKKGAIAAMFQRFGSLLLCGSLFIAYRGTTSIKGDYAVCILYESCMVVATATTSSKYHASLVIPLADTAFEEADNGKALQCHSTPHTWKLTFVSDGALFEILSVACSKVEADAWRSHITTRIAVEKQRFKEGACHPIEIRSPLTDVMRSVGKAYGRVCDFSRRNSMRRAATLGPLTELNQVIIKNTQAVGKDYEGQMPTISIPRSQSVMTGSHITVLAPRRSERIHLEAILADVWTKDTIPFPGLGSRREYSMRASAGHVIRKLSMASITSNFSKRSMSYTSITQASSFDDRSCRSRHKMQPPEQPQRKSPEKKIDFHSAPEAFLPEDFDLNNSVRARGRLAGLRTLTLGMERPRTPFFSTENQPPGGEVRRSRSIITSRTTDVDAMTATCASRSPPLSLCPPTTMTSSIQATGKQSWREEKVSVRQRARSRLARLLG